MNEEWWMMMKDGWRMDEGYDEVWRMNDEGWWFQASCWGVLQTDGQKDKLTNKRTDEQTDICDCRVAFATEKAYITYKSRLNITAEVYWLKIKTVLLSLL